MKNVSSHKQHSIVEIYMIYLLIDSDNISSDFSDEMELESEVNHLLSRLLANINMSEIRSFERVMFRFYGGWCEENSLTRRAQQLLANINDIFPFVYEYNHKLSRIVLNVQAELAVSLVCDPSNHLLHTFRRRQTLQGIKVVDPLSVGCNSSICSISGIKKLVRKKKCPDCGTPANKFIWREEQKLVDVMLAIDLIHLKSQMERVCLVTSDDDLWPAIVYSAYINDGEIHHLHAKHNRSLNPFYLKHAPLNYQEISYNPVSP